QTCALPISARRCSSSRSAAPSAAIRCPPSVTWAAATAVSSRARTAATAWRGSGRSICDLCARLPGGTVGIGGGSALLRRSQRVHQPGIEGGIDVLVEFARDLGQQQVQVTMAGQGGGRIEARGGRRGSGQRLGPDAGGAVR